eukprot:scaffold81997_cov41-Attheya_sp.AAC.1
MAPICHGFKSSIRGAYKDTIHDSNTIGQPIKNRSANETDWQDGSKCGGVRTGAWVSCNLALVIGIGSLAVGIGIFVIGIFGIGKLAVGIGICGKVTLAGIIGMMAGVGGWLGIMSVAKRTDSAGGQIGATGTFKAMAGN